MTTILVADDEESIRDVLRFYIRKEGYNVVAVKDGREALHVFGERPFDLVILDIMMPLHGGYEVCSAIRDVDPAIPVIFLSAKSDLIDKALGFKLGADDFITKPFDPEELVLRVNSCLRRKRSSGLVAAAAEEADPDVIVLGDLRINSRSREVTVGGEAVSLTAREYDVLACMANCPNTVFSRQQILDTVWGVGYYGDAGVVAVFIRKLREKIEPNPAIPVHILTEWGAGYRLV